MHAICNANIYVFKSSSAAHQTMKTVSVGTRKKLFIQAQVHVNTEEVKA